MAENLTFNTVFSKKKRGCRGWWFGTSKRRKAIHMEMKKQMFSKQIFAGSGDTTMGHRVHSDL